MATEAQILNVLDTLTEGQLESLSDPETAPVQHLRRILAHDNVVGLGVSEKISKGKRMDELALVFYVKEKKPVRAVRDDFAIPTTVPEPLSRSQAMPTDVVELGALTLDGKPLATKNPIQPGNSIGHHKCLGGTLGAIVKRGNTTLLLSNAHVLADNGRAKRGDVILYPAIADKGNPHSDVVATLDRSVAFRGSGEYVNRADCAVAKVTTKIRAVINNIAMIGGPTGTATARRGMRIVKVGRTTGRTTGEVRDVHFRFTVPYQGLGQIGFKDQGLCTRYSEQGDSGALVLEESSGKAVGLHFASAKNGSVFNPIGEVLRSLDVRLLLGTRKARKKPSATKRSSRL